MTIHNFQLKRNTFGRLVFSAASGETAEGVLPVRAFPITAPDDGISLVDAEGQELAWINHLNELPEQTRVIIEEELNSREFMPEISRIREVSSFTAPSDWSVVTNRGEATFTLKGEEDIRRIAGGALLIADNHGVHFVIRDIQQLDKASRKILDRFL